MLFPDQIGKDGYHLKGVWNPEYCTPMEINSCCVVLFMPPASIHFMTVVLMCTYIYFKLYSSMSLQENAALHTIIINSCHAFEVHKM